MSPSPSIRHSAATAPVTDDPDDTAVWINPKAPENSLIVGTNKVAAPRGALVVFGLDGRVRFTIAGLDRPNNVDILPRFHVNGRNVPVAVCTERLKSRLRVFEIHPDGRLSDLAPNGLPVFVGETGERAAPMGIALYERPSDGAAYAFVSRKTGPEQGYLHQYRITVSGGQWKAALVRSFGAFKGGKEIEAIVVDSANGYVYYADEGAGIRKYAADPDSRDAGRELALFATTGFAGDHEGIAIYATGKNTGYILAADQRKGGSVLHVYRREGSPRNPHDHTELAAVGIDADDTDGLEAVSAALGSRWPHGVVIAMNSGPKNFLLYDPKALLGKLLSARVPSSSQSTTVRR
jgi:3-phytase